MTDALSIAQSGMQSATVRLRNSAHNVANLATDDFRDLRTVQQTRPGGGSVALTQRDSDPRPVDLVNEVVEQSKASTQFKAAVRVIETDLEMKGTLLDAFA